MAAIPKATTLIASSATSTSASLTSEESMRASRYSNLLMPEANSCLSDSLHTSMFMDWFTELCTPYEKLQKMFAMSRMTPVSAANCRAKSAKNPQMSTVTIGR